MHCYQESQITCHQKEWSDSMWKRTIELGVILLTCFVASGCVVSSDATSHESGKKLKDSTLKQLEPGKTTKEWTISVLGTPSSRNKLDNGTEVFKYEYSKTVDEEFAIFLLWASDSEKTTSQSVCLEFRDNILTRYWTEHD
jgi:outer membrane protein assembly factor BamE (lipoprotein component of BamABCDE complex)